MDNEILHQIGEMKKLLGEHIISTKLLIDKLSEKQQEHSKELWGVPGAPGLSRDVDRLKLIGSVVKWQIGLIVAIVGERIWSFFGKH